MIKYGPQNPMCAALSTKSDENAHLSALCTTYVKRNGVCDSSSQGRSCTCVEVVGGQDRDEGKRRWRVRQHQDSQSIGAVGRAHDRSGRSDSVHAARVGNTSLDGGDTSHGHVAVVGETRWMVA